MVEKNIQFTVKDGFGNDVNCFILTSKCVSDSVLNVIYKQEDDPDDTIRYGKINKHNDDYLLSGGITDDELEELKKLLDKEIRDLVTNIVAFKEGK